LKHWKAQLAKEWLIFAALFLLGVIGVILWVLVRGFSVSDYFEAIFFATRRVSATRRFSESVFTWLLTLAPYFIFQIGRSIFWAVKTLRQPPE